MISILLFRPKGAKLRGEFIELASHFCKEPAFGTADKPTLRAYASWLGLQSGSAQKWHFIDV